MQVTEQQDGRRRCVHWDLPDQGWEDVARQIDPFLASAIQAIAVGYAEEPVAWLEINHWPDSGRLLVYPAEDGPYGDRGERIYFALHSAYLENEFARITEALADDEASRAYKELGDKVWEQVGDSLRRGQASRRLAEARKVHRFPLALFDYDFAEGLFRLTDLDEEATAQMQEVLARYRRGEWIGNAGGGSPES